MDNYELIEKLKEITQKQIELSEICSTLNINEYEVLSLIHLLRKENINISIQKKDNGIYLYNLGEKINKPDLPYKITPKNQQFKFVAIADTRIGSKSQQMEILNDIYDKAVELGYNNIILCGNITNGITKITSKYAEDSFLSDTLMQIDYIAEYFPKRDNIKTYFITGKKDDEHMKVNKINIGKRISQLREDMIFLGDGDCKLKIDKTNMLILGQNLEKTYTVSYRPQQQIDSFRSEDKPDILLYGGLLQMQKFTYRGVSCISIPSVCATTKEMNEKRHSNTIGAWYVTIETNNKGKLKNINAIDSVYYKTQQEDYLNYDVKKLIRKA